MGDYRLRLIPVVEMKAKLETASERFCWFLSQSRNVMYPRLLFKFDNVLLVREVIRVPVVTLPLLRC